MSTPIHKYVQHMAAEILRGNEALRRAGVTVVEQNDGELADEIAKALGEIDAPVAVVSIDGVELEHSNPARWAVDYSVLVTEVVPTNRGKPEFLTALDVALAALEALDGPAGHGGKITHTYSETEPGVLHAVLPMSGKFGIGLD